jgi:hypothetical protein
MTENFIFFWKLSKGRGKNGENENDKEIIKKLKKKWKVLSHLEKKSFPFSFQYKKENYFS